MSPRQISCVYLINRQVKAGTKGQPATPRDGAPVEITGLLKSTLRWLVQLSGKGSFPFKGVEANGELAFMGYKRQIDRVDSGWRNTPCELQGVE